MILFDLLIIGILINYKALKTEETMFVYKL